MTDKENFAVETGGPAFVTGVSNGMTLRDYFAAKAMQGELAAQDARNDGKGTGVVTSDYLMEFAGRCYAMADAMLAARKQGD